MDIKLNIRLTSSYNLRDPDLAHDVFPSHFVETLNWLGMVQADGTDWDDNNFALANGRPHLYLDVDFTSDPTGDHYGMSVRVRGAATPELYRTEVESVVPLFSYSLEPLYADADKLVHDAAKRFYEFIYWPGGWTCDGDIAKPLSSLDEFCSAGETPTKCNL